MVFIIDTRAEMHDTEWLHACLAVRKRPFLRKCFSNQGASIIPSIDERSVFVLIRINLRRSPSAIVGASGIGLGGLDIYDSVAQIGLDKWTRREPGEKLGGEGDHAHPRGDGTCHCNHKDWSPFPKPRADWLTRVVPKGRRSCGCAMP